MNIIIDSDPGIDDALALMLAEGSDELDIVALSVAAGNVGLTVTRRNALALRELLGGSWPVFSGCSDAPRLPRVEAQHIHGANGMGGIELPIQKNETDGDLNTLANLILNHPESLSLVTLGPLTNIAWLFDHYPETVDKIDGLFIMGGAIDGGNITDEAEFNFYADPDAAQRVIGAPIEKLIIGLDATRVVALNGEDRDEIKRIGNPVSDIASALLTFLFTTVEADGEYAYMHDPLTIAALLQRSILSAREGYLSIDDEGNRGKCHYIWHGFERANCTVAVDASVDKFKPLMLRALSNFSSNR